MIYICDLDTMESVGKQDRFSGRLNHHRIKVNKIYDWMYDFKDSKVAPGIIESSGKDWQEQRRFALQVQMKKTNFPTSPLKTIPIFPHFIPLPPSFKSLPTGNQSDNNTATGEF